MHHPTDSQSEKRHCGGLPPATPTNQKQTLSQLQQMTPSRQYSSSPAQLLLSPYKAPASSRLKLRELATTTSISPPSTTTTTGGSSSKSNIALVLGVGFFLLVFVVLQIKVPTLHNYRPGGAVVGLRRGADSQEVVTDWLAGLKNSTIMSKPRRSNPETYWKAASKWMTPRQTLPKSIKSDELAHVFDLLSTGRILKASSAPGGSQLKLLLILEGGQKVIFKPKHENIGCAWDQPKAEIAAFHLSRLLDLRRAPIAIGRHLDIKQEILPVATPEFHETFVTINSTANCFYGNCTYCGPENAVCPDKHGSVEGVMLLMLPSEMQSGSELKLGTVFSPFFLSGSGSEHSRKRAEQMKSQDYCNSVVKKKEISLQPRLLDIVETSVLDFLIHNADRHSYEYVDDEEDGAVLFIDQGKGFCNNTSHYDDMRLLTPLTQCCVLRDTTSEHLQWMLRWPISLSEALADLMSVDATAPVLLHEDLAALDRRMEIVQNEIRTCLAKHKAGEVIIEDTVK